MVGRVWRGIQRRLGESLLGPVDRLAYKRYREFPFGASPKADAGEYSRLWRAAKTIKYQQIDECERELGYSIDDEWFHKLALLTQVCIKDSGICYQHGRLLYATLRHYIEQNPCRNMTLLETGTARGFSALCLARALSDSGQSGKIVTFDVLPHDVSMFWNCIADAQGPRTRADLLHEYENLLEEFVIFHQGYTETALGKLAVSRIHFAFLDGSHTYQSLSNECGYVKKRQKRGDIIFFDDYTPQVFPGVVRAVDEMCPSEEYTKQIVTVSEERGYVIARRS
jgi:predicted O-methyltransferase YrrM